MIYHFCQLKILLDFLLTHPKPIYGNLKVSLKRAISNYNLTISDSSFAPTLINSCPSPNVKFNGQYLINNSTVSIKIINLYISYILDRWSGDLNTVFALNNCLFRSVRLTKNADPDKYKYSSYSIGFDSRSELSYRDRSMGKNVIIFGADMSPSVHIDNRRKDILVLGKRPKQGLHNTTRAEAAYPINFTESQKRLCWVYTIIDVTVSY